MYRLNSVKLQKGGSSIKECTIAFKHTETDVGYIYYGYKYNTFNTSNFLPSDPVELFNLPSFDFDVPSSDISIYSAASPYGRGINFDVDITPAIKIHFGAVSYNTYNFTAYYNNEVLWTSGQYHPNNSYGSLDYPYTAQHYFNYK